MKRVFVTVLIFLSLVINTPLIAQHAHVNNHQPFNPQQKQQQKNPQQGNGNNRPKPHVYSNSIVGNTKPANHYQNQNNDQHQDQRTQQPRNNPPRNNQDNRNNKPSPQGYPRRK